MTPLFWALILFILPVFYLLIVYYLPLRNTLFLETPKPTVFSRSAEKYDFKSFGAEIQVGFAKRDMTPPRFSWLAGYYPPHPGIFINDRIWVKSLALRDKNGSALVIVSCDLIGLLPDEIWRVNGLVTAISPNSILISATHTHSGPDTMGLWGIPPFSGKNKKYMEFMRQQIASAIDDSVRNLKDGRIRFANGEFKGYSGGREDNEPDREVAALQVLDKKGLAVTLVNFALHPDVVKSFRISADFPYFLYERLEQLTGGETMFVPGAIGGVQPLRNDGDYDAKIIGENLADRVNEILKNPIVSQRVLISGKKVRLNSVLANRKFERAAKLGIISNLFFVGNGRINADFYRINIGPAVILTVPGELFPKIWHRIKSKMPGNPKLIFGLTGGELGYILSPDDFDSGKHKYHVGLSVGKSFGHGAEQAMEMLISK